MGRVNRIVVSILLVFASVFLLAPVVIIVLSSFKSNLGIFNYPPTIIFTPTLEAYLSQAAQSAFFKPALSPGWIVPYFNTFLMSIASTGLALLVGMPAAYALARFEMPRKEFTAFSILALRMTPLVAATVPLFFLISYLNLLDTYLGLILIYTLFQLPYVVWLMRGFIEGVPKEITEAAQIDGASEFRTILRILIPLVRTGLVVTIVFCFLIAYNDYALVSLIGGFHTQNIPVALNGLVGQERVYWNVIFAVGTINLIPTLGLAFLVRKYLVTGFTLGLVKG